MRVEHEKWCYRVRDVPLQMSTLLLKLLRSWGIDRAVAYTILGRGWFILAGPFTLQFLATFLSPEEQGFHYTFASILSLQIFFELGLSYVILQFTSHEKAQLEWTSEGTLQGDAVAKSRISSLLRVALGWYSVAAALVIAVVLPVGYVFFGNYQPTAVSVGWQLPWIWIVLVSACTLWISPIYATLEGCGLVADIAVLRIWQGVVGSLLFWLALSQGWGLFAAPVSTTIGLLWGVGWLWFKKRTFLFDLLASHVRATVMSWRHEVWPFQWRIALTWFTSYFIFQLFNPVLFVFYGAVAAGRMGMSSNIVAAISTMAIAWVTTKAVPFGGLIAKREFKKLDHMFFLCLWQSLLVVVVGGVTFWLAAFYLYYIHHPLSQRLLDPVPLGLLIATATLNQVVGAEAVYLRAHKQEPFLGLTVLSACLIGLSTYFAGKQFGAMGMMAGYFTITLFVGLGGGTWIFIQKRRLWHKAQDG